jgi:hypothetical protein
LSITLGITLGLQSNLRATREMGWFRARSRRLDGRDDRASGELADAVERRRSG